VTKDEIRNVAASVRQRLRNKAREQQEDFGLVLTRYGLERFLYRLSQSPHCNQFVLKGAMLFHLWGRDLHRPTRDIDLLGHGDPDPDRFRNIIRDVCTQAVQDDGLAFDSDSVLVERMKEDEEYQGLRVRLLATLEKARIQIQIDIGFGDAVTPDATEVAFPTALDMPAPILKAYPRETVVAEKFQAMVILGIANSRLKDFYDLWILSQHYAFDGAALTSAIRATFDRRRTPVPGTPPLALTTEFSKDAQKLTQWRAFLGKGALDTEMSLDEVVDRLSGFLMPPVQSAAQNADFDYHWPPGGPWQSG
jgi:hypothetical protein